MAKILGASLPPIDPREVLRLSEIVEGTSPAETLPEEKELYDMADAVSYGLGMLKSVPNLSSQENIQIKERARKALKPYWPGKYFS